MRQHLNLVVSFPSAAVLAWVLATPAGAQVPAGPPPGTAAAASSVPGAGIQRIRELGGIQEYQLANGLQILLLPDSAQSTTTVNVTYRVGSRHESPGEYGMAHLLEHLLFRGTPTHRDIPEEFARRGMRFNGTTTVDRTNYFARFNADAATLDWAIELEADRMANSLVAQADLDKEMTVVRNEFERGENEPMQVLSQRVHSMAYTWHPYGRSTIGARSDIENVPITKLQAFYRRYYRPDNATLLVAGNFDPAQVLAVATRSFGRLPRPAEPIPEPYTTEPAQDGERSVLVRRVGGAPTLLAAYHVPAAGHPDIAPIVVYSLLMSLQPSGRLYQAFVDTRQAVATGMSAPQLHDPGLATVVAVLPPDGDIDSLQTRLLDMVEGRAGEAFTEAELQRVRQLAVDSFREQMKSPEGLIQQLSGLLGAGDWRLRFQLLEDLPKVTLADVERVRRAYFRPANRTLGQYRPAAEAERVAVPAAPALTERLAQLRPPPEVAAGEQFEPTPGMLGERTRYERLPSGIRLNTLRKQTRGDQVTAQIQLRFGTAEETSRRLGLGLLGDLIPEGTASMSRQAVQDQLVRLHAGMRVSSGRQQVTVSISAERDTLIETLRLVAGLLRDPALPAEAFERVRAAQIAGLQASRQNLGALQREAMRAHFNAARGVSRGDPDYQPSIDEQIERLRRVTLDDVRSFHRDFWSANEAEVAVAGALPEGLSAAVEQALGDWKKPSASRFVRHAPRHVPVAPARFDVQAADKTGAGFLMSQHFALNEREPDYLALLVGVHILGGGAMESRLNNRIRRQLGLSYGVSAQLSTSWWSNDAALQLGGSFAPQNREAVLQAVAAELSDFATSGPSESEVARARADLLAARKQARASDVALAARLNFQALEGLDWRFDAERDAQLAAVSVDQVKAAWQRYIRADQFVTSTAGDFAAMPPR